MNPWRDALIVVGVIFALILSVAVIRSAGSFSGGVLSGPRISTITAGNGSSDGRPRTQAQLERDKQKEIRSIENQIKEAESEIVFIEQELENIERFGENSIYKNQITIVKRSSSLKKTNVDDEYITLKVSSNNTSRINLDGWKIESAVTGRSYKLPDTVYLIISGIAGNKQPIFAAPGDTIYINTGRSPIGSSFKVNKCSGYFTQFQNFKPSIRNICPSPEEEILNFYTADQSIFRQNNCLDYIENLRTCKVTTEPLPLFLTSSCQDAIINEVNYNRCVENHKNDDDFLIGEWRVFLRRNSELWREKRELIKLLDADGKTVDYFSY